MSLSGSGIPDLGTLTDRELVELIVQSEHRERSRLFQQELYRRYSGKVYHKSLSLLKNPEAAKDVTHDIFIKIFLNLDRYKGDAAFYSWVFAITYNQCFDYLKRLKKLPLTEGPEMAAAHAADEEALADKLLKEARYEQLERGMAKLKEAERLVLIMFYQDGLSIREIAELLQTGESAVKMRLKRSRDHLAAIIKRENHGMES